MSEDEEKQNISSSSEPDEKSIPLWIRELFAKTWDPELIISGIAVFALIQLPDLLDEAYSYYRKLRLPGHQEQYAILGITIRILLYNFIIHIILRGFWVGLVGLQSVFPKGAQIEKLNYSNFFLKKLSKNTLSLGSLSVKLDNVCSILFSFSFLIVLAMVSAFLCLILFIIISFFPLFAGIETGIFTNVLALVFLSGSILYFIDFVTLGLLKKNETISKIYYPIYWFLSKITLAFLYRPIYYTFISNLKKWKLIKWVLVYFVFVWLISYNSIAAQLHWSRPWKSPKGIFYFFDHTPKEHSFSLKYYLNLNEGKTKPPVFINSDVIKGEYLKLVIVYNVFDDPTIKEICDEASILDTLSNEDSVHKAYEELTKERKNKIAQIALDCLSSFYKVYINDSLCQNLDYMFVRPHKAIITYIPVSHLPKGKNILEVKLGYEKEHRNHYIPFWIDRNE